MTVHIVTFRDADKVEIVQVFDSIGKAQTFCGTLSEADEVNAVIHSFQVQ